jgi:hypothetical protein
MYFRRLEAYDLYHERLSTELLISSPDNAHESSGNLILIPATKMTSRFPDLTRPTVLVDLSFLAGLLGNLFIKVVFDGNAGDMLSRISQDTCT